MSPLHAVAVALAVDPDGPLIGLLILGEPGVGKSSLALALIETCPYRRTALIADDAVIMEAQGSGLTASAPAPIAGLIELRGVGPAPVRHVARARLSLAIDLSRPAERVSEPDAYRPCGAAHASIPLYPLRWKGEEAVAPHRVRRLAASILGGQLLQRTQDSGAGQSKSGE